MGKNTGATFLQAGWVRGKRLLTWHIAEHAKGRYIYEGVHAKATYS